MTRTRTNRAGSATPGGNFADSETELSIADPEALPTERMSVERQVAMLKAIHSLSGDSRAPLRISQVAQHLGVATATAGPAARFLIGSGLLDGGRGIYTITEAGAKFALLWDAQPDDARRLLHDLWGDMWFSRKAERALAAGPLPEVELARRLQQGKSGPSARGLYLVEWMAIALLVRRDEMGIVASTAVRTTPPSPQPPPASTAPPPIAMNLTIEQIRELPDRQWCAYMTAIEAIFEAA